MYRHRISVSDDYPTIRMKEEFEKMMDRNDWFDKTINNDISEKYGFENVDNGERFKYLLHFIINHVIDKLGRLKAFVKLHKY